MKIIQNNPYRIAGILSNATAKELQKQKGKIKAFSKVGKEITSEFDFDFLNSIERTEQNIEKAFSNIEQNQDKVNNSLFWFLKSSPFDETAISYLIKGDNEKAKEIWGKVTNGKEVNSKNFSAFNNIGTLKLLSKSEFEIKEGIEAKIKLIESEHFESFVHTVADQTFTIDNKKQSQKLIDELLTQFKKQYSSATALDLFSNCNDSTGSTQKYLSKKFTEEPMHNIESNIESVKRKRKDNKSDSYSFGLKLFVDTKDDLTLLKSLLGANDLKYKMVADNLAKEVMQCGIDYFQEWKESKDPSKDSLKLLKYAKSIAIGSQTKDRVKSNIEGIEEFKNSDMLEVNMILRHISNLFENLPYNHTIDTHKINLLLKEKVTFKIVDKIALSENSTIISEFYRNLSSIRIWIKDNSHLNNIERQFYLKLPKSNSIKSTIDKIRTIENERKVKERKEKTKKIAYWIGGILLGLLIIFGIWGEEGLETVFGIVGIIVVLGVIGWLQNL